jgi:hypothetical protein
MKAGSRIPAAQQRRGHASSRGVDVTSGARVYTQIEVRRHPILYLSRIPRTEWGRPPGLRGSPRTRLFVRRIRFRPPAKNPRGAACGRGRPPRNLCTSPPESLGEMRVACGPLRALTSFMFARFVPSPVVFSSSPGPGSCRFRTPVWSPGITAGAQALAILVVHLGIAKNP